MTTADVDCLQAGWREDFAGLTVRDQHAFFAENGFLWIPDAVSPEQVARIVDEMGGDAAPNRLEFDEHWPGGTLAEIISCPAVIGAVRACYGDDIRFFKGVFATWVQQSDENLARGRQILHRDYTGFEPPEDPRNTPASWCNRRLLFHRPDGRRRAAVGRSRKPSLSRRAEPQLPGELCRRGAHGAGARWRRGAVPLPDHPRGRRHGVRRRPRPSAFMSYRPGWAAPLAPVEEWPDEVVRGASPELRTLLAGQNDGVPVGPDGIINPA